MELESQNILTSKLAEVDIFYTYGEKRKCLQYWDNRRNMTMDFNRLVFVFNFYMLEINNTFPNVHLYVKS